MKSISKLPKASEVYRRAAKYVNQSTLEGKHTHRGCCSAIAVAVETAYNRQHFEPGRFSTEVNLITAFARMFRPVRAGTYWFGSRQNKENELTRTIALLLMAEIAKDEEKLEVAQKRQEKLGVVFDLHPDVAKMFPHGEDHL